MKKKLNTYSSAIAGVIVRDAEVDDFYTAHFAPAIRFLRERWLNSLEKPQQKGIAAICQAIEIKAENRNQAS